jgi:hypothetical protein
VGKGVIIPHQREEIKRKGEALTEHLSDPSKTATREAIYAQAKRWGANQVANYRLRVARTTQVVLSLCSQEASQGKAGDETNDDEPKKQAAPEKGATE